MLLGSPHKGGFMKNLIFILILLGGTYAQADKGIPIRLNLVCWDSSEDVNTFMIHSGILGSNVDFMFNPEGTYYYKQLRATTNGKTPFIETENNFDGYRIKFSGRDLTKALKARAAKMNIQVKANLYLYERREELTFTCKGPIYF